MFLFYGKVFKMDKVDKEFFENKVDISLFFCVIGGVLFFENFFEVNEFWVIEGIKFIKV